MTRKSDKIPPGPEITVTLSAPEFTASQIQDVLVQAIPEPEVDENAGLGGSYTVDPKTGRRTLIHRTESILLPAAPSAPASESSVDEN